MTRTSWTLWIGLMWGSASMALAADPAAESASGSDIKILMARVAQTEIRDSPDFADYVPAHYDLADALIRADRPAAAIQALRKAVDVDGWNESRVFQLGMLEVSSDPAAAFDRIDFVAHRGQNSALRQQAQFLLSRRDPPQPSRYARAPMLPGHALHVVGYAGSDPLVMQAIAAAIGREFGIAIIPIRERPIVDTKNLSDPRERAIAGLVSRALEDLGPFQIETVLASLDLTVDDLSDPGKRESFAHWYAMQQAGGHGTWETLPASGRRQLDAGVVLGRLAGDFEEYLSPEDSLGVLAVVGDDLHAEGADYVLEYGGPTLGVISYARLAPRNLPRHRLISRATRVGLAVAGTVIPIGTCGTPSCPRSPARGHAELDRKSEHLCEDCRTRLSELYERRRSLVVSRREDGPTGP